VARAGHPLVGPALQSLEVAPVGLTRVGIETLVTNLALHLAFEFGRVRRAGVDVEAHHRGIAAVGRVDRAAGAGSATHGRLLVIDPDDGRDSFEATERFVVHTQPGELVLARRPHHRVVAGVRELQVKGVERATLAAYAQVSKLAPIGLGLGSGRCLHASARSLLRCPVARFEEPLQRAQAARVVVLVAQPLVERRQIQAIA
jgi:hypothetical protein